MIPAHLKLAREIEQLLHDRAPDAKSDADFAELVLPALLVRLTEAVGRPRMLRALEELRSATEAPPAPPGDPIRCDRCAFLAVFERWHPNLGVWRPVCADHARSALPLEIRKIPFGTRLARKSA